MKGKEPTDESKARYIRRHEISFSAIQGDHSEDYLDRYLYEHSSQGKMDIVDKMVAKIDRKLLRKSMFKLPEKDRIILCQYLTGTKQNKIAESLGMSPSAVHQYLEKIIYNYRAILCNRKEFQESSLSKNLRKLRLCMGEGPYFLTASICSFVGYPLCLAIP